MIQIETKDDYGMWVTMRRCYHDGECYGVDNCINCPGGWTGPKCEEVPYGLEILIAGFAVGLGLILPTLGMVWTQRHWVPLQERGSALLCMSGGSALLFCVTAPAASNPLGYGIALVVDPAQPENRFWEIWLPYTVAFGLWFNCLFIRMHNLYLIHMRATTPFSLALQVPVLWVPWIVASALHLPQSPECVTAPGAVNTPGLCTLDESNTIQGLQRRQCELLGNGKQCAYVSAVGRATFPQLTHIAWLTICTVFVILFLRDSKKLLPLFREIPDLVPNIVIGFLSLMAVMTLHTLQLLRHYGYYEYDYTNPAGMLSVMIPGTLIALLALHVAITQTYLVYKAIKKDVATLEKYTREGAKGSDSDDTADEDSEDEARRRGVAYDNWATLGRTKGMAIVKLSKHSIEKLAKSYTPSSLGAKAVTPLTTMLARRERDKHKRPKREYPGMAHSQSEDDEAFSEYDSEGSAPSENETEDSMPSTPSVKGDERTQQSKSDAGADSVSQFRGRRGGRGGRGASRGKTVRGSRGGALRGDSGGSRAASGGVSTAKTGRIIDALMTGQLTAEEAKAKLGVPPPKKKDAGPTPKQQQIRKAASLFSGVEQLLREAEAQDPAQPRPRRGSKDSFDTSSDEEEHARIEQEVIR